MKLHVLVPYGRKFFTSFKKIYNASSSPSQLATSFSVGIYVAFSPFPGFHSALLLLLRFFFPLISFPVMFFACALNNPWTMIPFYALDYGVGYWVVHVLFGYNPSLVFSLDKVGMSGKLCLWSFLIGGNFLGIGVALISYPIMKRFFEYCKSSSFFDSYENNSN